jgi:uncharacterized protein with HEPN domain
MTGPLADKERTYHILDAIREVEAYVAGVTFPQFLANSEKRFATIKQIEIIGEACNRITNELKLAHPEVAWKPINGFRNISIHEYFGVNLQLVWEIATVNLPELKDQFTSILKEFAEPGEEE